MKKIIKHLLVAILLIPSVFMLGGCDSKVVAVSIDKIEKTSTIGNIDTYTVRYTDGSTTQFTITNGEDGENIYTNITINDLYEQVKPLKEPDYTLLDFINEYLDIRLDASAVASSRALRSAVSIFVEHQITIPDYDNIINYSYNSLGQLTPIYGVKNSISWGAGAGVIYDLDTNTGDAYIMTNYHVCFGDKVNAKDGIGTRFTCFAYGAETIDYNDLYYLSYYNDDCAKYKNKFKYDVNGLPIIDYGYGAIEAEYVGGSRDYDIAVLKVSASDRLKNSDYLPASIQNSDDVVAGETAIAIGNPDASGISVTNGVVSVDNEYIQVAIDDVAVALREFRIDTPVNPGNSGGGLFDGHGNLIGIVNAKTADTSVENMSYAIPSNIATGLAQSIIDNCDGVSRKTNRVKIGITIGATDSQAEYDEDTGLMRIKEQVTIIDIEAESVAQMHGLKKGDIINSITITKPGEKLDFKIDRTFTLVDAMLKVREGDIITFNCTRIKDNEFLTTSFSVWAEDFVAVE